MHTLVTSMFKDANCMNAGMPHAERFRVVCVGVEWRGMVM